MPIVDGQNWSKVNWASTQGIQFICSFFVDHAVIKLIGNRKNGFKGHCGPVPRTQKGIGQ